MYTVVIGGLKLASKWSYPKFIWFALKSLKQAKSTEGCVEAQVFQKDSTYFAMSVWESPVAMKRFAHSGLHAEMMSDGSHMLASSRSFSYQSEIVPSKSEALSKWSEGQN